MKLVLTVHGIRIIPEDAADEVYIYAVLGLKKGGDQVRLTRTDVSSPPLEGLSAKYRKIDYLHTLDCTPFESTAAPEIAPETMLEPDEGERVQRP